MTNEQQADKLFAQSIVIDALTYGPVLSKRDYITDVNNAGVTAHFTVIDHDDNMQVALERMANWHEMLEENNGMVARTVDDIKQAKKLNRPCVIMGSQNPKPIEEDLGNIRILHTLGLRIMQLAYNSQNYIGAGGTDRDSGVTEFGKQVIKELNRVGILIDLSHCGDQTVMDAIKLSEKPVAITHANPRALVEHGRNKTDEHLKALVDSGGVVGLTAWAPFCVVDTSRRPNIDDFLDMTEYVIKLVGIDHVGFGLDLTPHWDWAPEDYYDNFQKLYPNLAPYKVEERMVQGLEDVSKIKNIAYKLLKRGYSDSDITKILGGNFINLFEKVWL